MTQSKIQFYVNPKEAAMIAGTVADYESRMKKTDIYTRLLILGIQVIIDLEVDLSSEPEVSQVASVRLSADCFEGLNSGDSCEFLTGDDKDALPW